MEVSRYLLLLIVFALAPTFVLSETPACFVNGRCLEGHHIDGKTAKNEIACLELCHGNPDCQWFSFSVDYKFCDLLSDCGQLDESSSWVSGQRNCSIPQCWVTGQCQGLELDIQHTTQASECLNLCKEHSGCSWFTYFSITEICILYQSCDTLDETCQYCLTGETNCLTEDVPQPKGFTKLLVAAGQFNGSRTDKAEIIDLSSDGMTCLDFQNFPFTFDNPIGGLFNHETIKVCGGCKTFFGGICNISNECHDYLNDSWVQTQSMFEGRCVSAYTAYPSALATSKLDIMVIDGNVWGMEVFTTSGWKKLDAFLPEETQWSCAVTLNSTFLLTIGGQTRRLNFTSATYLFDAENEIWSDFFPLITPRRDLKCGVIQSALGPYVIVAGGFNGGFLSTVEVLEPESQAWKEGPSLPRGITGGAMVEDTAANSLLYVGGRYENNPYYSADIYRLAGPLTVTSRWEKLPQQLKYPRFWHVAFFVPDSLVHCQKIDPELDSNQIEPL